MAWDWNAPPENCIFYDCETQSLADLKKVSLRKYVDHASTRISLAAFIYGDQKILWVLPGRTPTGIRAPEGWDLHIGDQPPADIVARIAAGMVMCAHNANFDKMIWDKCIGLDAMWTDSMPMCRSAGLPGGLEKVCKALFGATKDARGYALINMLCKAKVLGDTVLYPICTTGAWIAFAEYCCKDVELLARMYPMVYPFRESKILEVDRIVNERGIPVDAALAAKLVLLQDELVKKHGETFADLTGLEAGDARSVKKVIEWMESIGVKVPTKVDKDGKVKKTLERKELTRLLKQPDAFCDGPNDELSGAVEALKLRIEMSRATAGKALAIVRNVEPDWFVRDQVIYHGAHTGRWSGRGIQPHNFPKGIKGDVTPLCRKDVTLEEIEAFAKEIGCTPSDVIATMLRPCIASHTGNLSIADFGAIEARVIAWLCDETHAIQEFFKWDADPYSTLASEIFGRPISKKDIDERFLGKALILGCGFGMGWRKFVLYCAVQGLDLDKLGIDGKAVVKVYRERHPKIVQGWEQLHEATFRAIRGDEVVACKCRFYSEDGNMICQLPSGRRLVYRNARIEMREPAYAKMFAFACEKVETVVFDHPHGYEGFLYGGRTAENITQACARDVMADALVEVNHYPLPIVMHCHDEIVDGDDKIEELVQIMSTPPRWASDLPVFVEGFTHTRYTKNPPKGVKKVDGLNGIIKVHS